MILRPPLDLETSSSGNCSVRRVTGLDGGRTWQELGFMIHDTQGRLNMEGAVESLQTSPCFAEDFVQFFWIWRAPFPELHCFVQFPSQLLSEQSSFPSARLCYFHADFPSFTESYFIVWKVIDFTSFALIFYFHCFPYLIQPFSLLMGCQFSDAKASWGWTLRALGAPFAQRALGGLPDRDSVGGTQCQCHTQNIYM